MSTEARAPRHPVPTCPHEPATVTVDRISTALTAYLDRGYEVRLAADGWVLLSRRGTTFVLAEHATRAPFPREG